MRRALALMILLPAAVVCGGSVEAAGKWWIGGGAGFGFGNVSYVDISAVGGYWVTPRFTPGARISFRQREQVSSGNRVETNDYGASVFLRYKVWKPVFAHLEYEYVSFEFIQPNLTTERTDYESVLGGAGVVLPLSKHVSFFSTALYNFSYDSDELRSPYSEPWILRAGIVFGF